MSLVLWNKQKSSEKKSEKQQKLAQKIAKLLLYGYQSVCFCVRSTWKMSLSLARALTLLSFLRSRQNKRTVRPLVLGTLFRASSSRLGLLFVTSESDVYTHAVKSTFAFD